MTGPLPFLIPLIFGAVIALAADRAWRHRDRLVEIVAGGLSGAIQPRQPMVHGPFTVIDGGVRAARPLGRGHCRTVAPTPPRDPVVRLFTFDDRLDGGGGAAS